MIGWGRTRVRGANAITRFWGWWEDAGSRSHEIGVPDGREAAEFHRRIRAIHPTLTGEVLPAPTPAAERLLVVTAAEDPRYRSLARRWLLAAPHPDGRWAYTDLRPPSAEEFVLHFGGHRLASGETWVRCDSSGGGYEVRVWHPQFLTLGDDACAEAAESLVLGALGEELRHTWVAGVRAVSTAPSRARRIGELCAMVTRYRDLHVDSDGGFTWNLMDGHYPRGRVVVVARRGLSPVTAPLRDCVVSVHLPYTDVVADGSVGPGSVQKLHAMEQHLQRRVETSAELVAAVSWLGRRTLYFVAESGVPVAAQLEAAVRGWDEGPVQVQSVHDPLWRALDKVR